MGNFYLLPTSKQGQQSGPSQSGADGRQIELRTNAGFIEWRYKGPFNDKWTVLVPLKDIKGDKGQGGDRGIQGVSGIDGANGETGAVGPQGETGAKGETGATGPIGANGAKGATGFTGAKGETGQRGKAGTNGIDGTPGTDGKDGQQIELQTIDGAIKWRYIDSTTWNDLVPLANLKGPKGDRGPQGEQGERGLTGYTGAPGYNGQPGAKGDKGDKGDPGSGAGSNVIFNEVPTDAGTGHYNTAFTFTEGSTALYINGLRQILDIHYTEIGNAQILTTGMFAGAIITIDYIRAD